MKTNKIILAGLIVLASAVFFLSCENPLALGDKLDLEGPRVTIISPEPRAIGEDFLLKGSVTDKSPVDRIKITAVLGSEDTFKKQWRYTRSTGKWQVSEDSGVTWSDLAGSEWNGSANAASWVVPIDMTISGSHANILQGEYMFSVQAWDSGDWSDDNSLKTHVLIFDKDPPRVQVFNPPLYLSPTDAALTSLFAETDWKKPELLGKYLTQEFQLQWQIKDDNAVKSIELLFYDKDVDVDGLAETELPQNYLYRYATDLLPSDFNGSIWVPDLTKGIGHYDGQQLTGGELLGGEIKASVDDKTIIKVVALCYDAASHSNFASQEKVLGYFIFWPQARAPWITYTDGMGKPAAYENMTEAQYKAAAEAGLTAKMFYPGRSVKSNSFQAQGVSKVEFQLYDYTAGKLPDYSALTPLSLAYMELDETLDKATHQLDATKTTMTILNPKRKSGDYSTIFPWDFTPTKKSANYIVRARAFDFNGNAGEYYEAVFRVQDISFPDFPTSPAPAAGEPLFKFIGKPETDSSYYPLASPNVPANCIRISGVVADMTHINSVYMVWINPRSEGYAGMSQLSYYRDLNYIGWKNAMTASLAGDGLDGILGSAYIEEGTLSSAFPNKVWKLKVTDLTRENTDGRKEYRYDQIIDLSRFNIGTTPPNDQPLKSQVFLLRAEGADNTKATIITYAPQGDESFPKIEITNVTISGRTEPLIPNKYDVIAQFTPNQIITVNGTWKEDSTEFLPIETYFKPNFGVTVSGQTASVVLDPLSGVVTPPPGVAAGGTWTATLGPISSGLAASLRDTLVVNVEGKDIGGNISEAGASWLIESDYLQLMRISSEVADTVYNQGKIIDIFLEFNKAVQITNYSINNPPRLVLNTTGGATAYATYLYEGQGQGSTTRHKFRYNVDANQNTPANNVLDVTGLSLQTPVAWDAAGYPFTWHRGSGAEREEIRVTNVNTHTGQIVNGYRVRRLPTSSSGTADAQFTLGNGKNITIDTAAPTVQSISASQAGDYTTGGVITITVTFSEPVEINTSSPPQLLLQGFNGTSTTLTTSGNVSGNTTNALTFTYTVVAGDTTRGSALSITGHSGTIADLAGNALATISGTLTGRYVDALNPAAPTVRLFSTNVTPANATNANTISSTVNNTAIRGFSDTAKNLGNVYHPNLYLAIEGTDTSVGGTSTGTHKLSRLEYSINNGTSWVRLANITNTPILLPQPGSYVLVARQIDRAGNISTVTPALTFIWDPGSLISRIDSTTANGTYSNNTTPNSINITVYFRKSLTFSGTQTITLNATRENTPITVSQTVNGSRSELSFTYTILNGDNTPTGSGRTPYLDVTGLSLSATDTNTTVPNDLPETANRLGQRKDIIVTTGPLAPITTTTQPVYAITAANDEAAGTISITFNRDISKGSGNITIAQSTTGYRLPAVLTEAQSARYRSARNFSANYTRGTNGFIAATTTTGSSDTATKYVLNYAVDTPVTPSNANNATAIAQMAYDFLQAETVTLPVTSQDVTVSGRTLTITLSGSNALQVLGASHTITIPQNCVQDSLGYSWPTATAAAERSYTYTTPGINRSFIRVDKQINRDTVARTGTGNNASTTVPWLTSTQPTTTRARLDCRTPNSVVRYNATGTAYNTTGTTNNGTGTTDQTTSRNQWTNTDTASNRIDSGTQNDPQTNGTNYDSFTNTATATHITVGDTNEQGYVWRITARGRNGANGNTYSDMSDEVAFRTVLTYQLAGVATTSVGAGPASGDALWIRGGDAISSSSVPGFPLTWGDDYDVLSAEGKRAGIRLMRMASVTTNFSTTSQWKWVTWEINVQTYFDVVLGRDVNTTTAPDAARAWQYGPRTWAYQRGGWSMLKEQYTLYPGKHRWLRLYNTEFVPGGPPNWSTTFQNRPNLATSITQ